MISVILFFLIVNTFHNTPPQAEVYTSYTLSLKETKQKKKKSYTPSQPGTTWSTKYKDRLVKIHEKESALNQT